MGLSGAGAVAGAPCIDIWIARASSSSSSCPATLDSTRQPGPSIAKKARCRLTHQHQVPIPASCRPSGVTTRTDRGPDPWSLIAVQLVVIEEVHDWRATQVSSPPPRASFRRTALTCCGQVAGAQALPQQIQQLAARAGIDHENEWQPILRDVIPVWAPELRISAAPGGSRSQQSSYLDMNCCPSAALLFLCRSKTQSAEEKTGTRSPHYSAPARRGTRTGGGSESSHPTTHRGSGCARRSWCCPGCSPTSTCGPVLPQEAAQRSAAVPPYATRPPWGRTCLHMVRVSWKDAWELSAVGGGNIQSTVGSSPPRTPMPAVQGRRP
jgi:hypothetical protein